MKKSIFALGLAALALVSCNINDLKEFDDADAFVAFPKTSYKFTESAGKVSIPVHATSLGLAGTSVVINVVDGSAVNGKDFNIAGSGTVAIEAGKSEGSIEIEILPMSGVFTGDKTFTIELASATSFNIGATSSVTVTILDEDHPLSALFGTYSGDIEDAWGSGYEQSITIGKDDSDVSKVWLSEFDPYWTGYAPNKVYGIVSDDKSTITIPKGQEVGYYPAYYKMYFYGFSDDDFEVDTDIVISVSADCKTLVVETNWASYCEEDLSGSGYEGFWSAYYGGYSLKKK